MSPITKIALRRIKKNSRKSIFLTIAVLFSMLMISFFIFFQLQTIAVQNPAYKGLPFTELFRLRIFNIAVLLPCFLLLLYHKYVNNSTEFAKLHFVTTQVALVPFRNGGINCLSNE